MNIISKYIMSPKKNLKYHLSQKTHEQEISQSSLEVLSKSSLTGFSPKFAPIPLTHKSTAFFVEPEIGLSPCLFLYTTDLDTSKSPSPVNSCGS